MPFLEFPEVPYIDDDVIHLALFDETINPGGTKDGGFDFLAITGTCNNTEVFCVYITTSNNQHIQTMKAIDLKVGQTVTYRNGNPSIYTGEIVKITGKKLVIIDDEAEMELWNAGYAVGSCIDESQIISITKN